MPRNQIGHIWFPTNSTQKQKQKQQQEKENQNVWKQNKDKNKAQVKRRTSHESNSMQISSNNGFCSFALSSTHVKFDVWPGPKNSIPSRVHSSDKSLYCCDFLLHMIVIANAVSYDDKPFISFINTVVYLSKSLLSGLLPYQFWWPWRHRSGSEGYIRD